MIQIAIADDEALFRKGIIRLLEDENTMQVSLEANDGEDLLNKLSQAETFPQVLLLDMKMPKMNGIETAKRLQIQYPHLKFIILSTYFNKAFIINMIEMGAAAYLPKNTHPDKVKRTIREVVKNGFSYQKEVMEVIRENMIQKTRPKLAIPFGAELTTRELEILQLICEEYTTAEIARKLYISPRTVDGHRNNLLQKLNCRNVAGLVVHAIQNELVRVSKDFFNQ